MCILEVSREGQMIDSLLINGQFLISSTVLDT